MADVEANTFAPPDWLDQKFFQLALKDGLRRGSLQLADYDICPATNKGDNYVSQMFRVSALIGSKQQAPERMSLVVKSLPAGELAEKFVQETQFFVKETKMLTDTLPQVQKVLDEIGMPKLFPEVIYHQGPPKDLLIMEDLCKIGFKPAKRLEGLDLRHSILAMESLATLHGASLEAIRRNPEIKKEYDAIFWHRNNAAQVDKMVLDNLNRLAGAIDKWNDMPKDLSETIRRFVNVAMEKFYAASEREEDELAVLCHGDTWTNNFMFKYQNGVPVALKFVDFQLSAYNSPLADILYFVFTSPQVYVRTHQLNLLLQAYHRRLEDVCRKLKYPLKFSLDELKMKFYQKLAFGLGVSVVIFPVTKAPSHAVADLNDIIGADGSEVDDSLFHTDGFVKGMKSMLPIFIKQGLFNV